VRASMPTTNCRVRECALPLPIALPRLLGNLVALTILHALVFELWRFLMLPDLSVFPLEALWLSGAHDQQ